MYRSTNDSVEKRGTQQHPPLGNSGPVLDKRGSVPTSRWVYCLGSIAMSGLFKLAGPAEGLGSLDRLSGSASKDDET